MRKLKLEIQKEYKLEKKLDLSGMESRCLTISLIACTNV